MARLDEALQSLHALRAQGVRFSIDDFGTGYSSLAYLSSLPIDTLKIDRSFVMELEHPQNLEIVRAVVTLGHSLGRQVVAEGIETAAQLSRVRSLGVNYAQGYLLSRPLSPPQVDELLSLLDESAAVIA
jgi:EAL domain-containing protein (putative c-di-GMP-specific phosphodiesterase class I)